jgi:post-segregation antitoxin (ccd killing protein)
MVRVQVQLEPAQLRRVRRRAKHLGVSVAEVVRRCLDAELRRHAADNPAERARRALAAAGRYAEPAGGSETAAKHDAALAEAYKS